MMDMRWPTLPRDKIYYNVLNYCVCGGGFVGRGDLEGGDWVCAGFLCVFFFGGVGEDIVTCLYKGTRYP